MNKNGHHSIVTGSHFLRFLRILEKSFVASPVAGTVSIEGCFCWCSLGFSCACFGQVNIC